jgi:large subunit ribosomal protein L25
LVPGVLYGGAKDRWPSPVKSNESAKALSTPASCLGHLVTLKYGSRVAAGHRQGVDMHPVTDEPWHFDLYRVDAHQQIKIEVPCTSPTRRSPGLKRGGTLGVILHTVTVSCHADSIPKRSSST